MSSHASTSATLRRTPPTKDGRTYGVGLDLVSNKPPVVDPTEQWIAYGVVVDDDRDGVPGLAIRDRQHAPRRDG